MKSLGGTRDLSDGMGGLFALVRRDAGRLFGYDAASIEVLSLEVRESSEIARARVTTPAGVRHVFAKIVKPRPGETGLTQTRLRLRHDVEVTRHVFEAMGSTEDLRAVELLACYEEALGIVTNEAPGLPLDVVIARAARWPAMPGDLAELENTFARIGRWIASFQRVAPEPTPSPLDLDATRQYIDIRLRRLVDLAGAGFGERDRHAVLAYFDTRAAEVPSAARQEVPVHGDITPSNIIVESHAVTVLDFAMTARGSRYLDLARLYSQLEFYIAKPQYRPHVIARLQRALLSGYEPALLPENPLFEICALQHVVCHFLSHARRPGTFPFSLYSRHLCRLHRRWLGERSRSVGVRHLVAAPASGSSR